MQHQRGDGGGSGGRDRPYGGAQLGGPVAQERDHRGHQDPASDAVLGERADHLEAALRGGRARLHRAPQLGVGEADRHRDADVRHLSRLHQQIEVAQDQRALRQDREGVGLVAQRGQDARHQAVAALGALVAVDVRAHRDVLALPAA